MTTTLEDAKSRVDPEDTYVLDDHVYWVKEMSPDQIRQAVRQLVKEAEGILGQADDLATWAADRFPGEQFSRIIRCLSIGLPSDLRDRFLIYIRERFAWFGDAREFPAIGSPRYRQIREAAKDWAALLTEDERRRVIDHWCDP
jgi:hypothetical protein